MHIAKILAISIVFTAFSSICMLMAQSSDALLINFVPHSSLSMSDVAHHAGHSISILDENVSGNLDKSAAGALLRSFILPGWGHYYIDNKNWNRGRVHLFSDVVLLGSYFGLRLNANRLETNLNSFAKQHAGVDIRGKGRGYLLNIAEFSSIQEYNDFQERSRNWDQIYEITNDNIWSWNSDENRLSFLKLDNRIQNNRQQLPAILSLMVVNRIVSGISAFSRATQQNNARIYTSFTMNNPEYVDGKGVQLNIKVSF